MRPVASLRHHVGRLVASSPVCRQCRLVSTKADDARRHVRAALAAKVTSTWAGDEHGDALTLDPDTKKITTPAGDLPISPVMDPDWIEARQRFKRPKAKPANDPASQGRFRKKLALNPFARALATPWRMCSATQSGMPRYFLQDFKIVAHPETKAPWWTPGNIDAPPKWETDAPIDEAGSQWPPSDTPGQKPRAPTSPSGYLVARNDLIESIGASRQDSRLAGQHVAMVVGRSRLVRLGIIPKLVWRPDMHLYLLDEMRRRVVDDLLYLARLRADGGRTHLVPCAGWADITRDMPQRGCVLWHSGAGGAPPGPLATLDVEGASYERALPVHNLDMLLGEAHLARLKEAELFRDHALVVARKRLSLGVQLRLWKLQGYLAAGAET